MLQQLREAGLTANPVKCELHWLNYVGHIVGNEKVYPGKNKVQAAENFPLPRTKKQIRAFLGLTGYYRHFILNYASIAMPLTDLMKKVAPNQLEPSIAE